MDPAPLLLPIALLPLSTPEVLPGSEAWSFWGLVLSFYLMPDFTLLAVGAQQPQQIVWWTWVAILGSLLNGWSVYALTRWGRFLLCRLPQVDARLTAWEASPSYQQLSRFFHQHGAKSIIVGSLAHMSYLGMMSYAGITRLRFSQVFWGCVFGRGLKFILLGAFVYAFGLMAKDYVEYLPWLGLLAAILWLGFGVFKLGRKMRTAPSGLDEENQSLENQQKDGAIPEGGKKGAVFQGAMGGILSTGNVPVRFNQPPPLGGEARKLPERATP